MNRKDRRAAGKPADLSALFASAVQDHQAGRWRQAEARYGQILAADPRNSAAFHNLGVLLLQSGKTAQAAASFRAALALTPGLPDALANLADACNTMGNALWRQGRVDEAATQYRAAAEAAPEIAEIWNNLALALLAQDDRQGAVTAILRALALGETPDCHRSFVQIVKDLRIAGDASSLRPFLLRALREGWDRPDDLARICADVILQDGTDANDELLLALLVRTPNLDWTLEQKLTRMRRRLLQDPVDIAFAGALAQQCFINEYVFACSEEDYAAVDATAARLAAALQSGNAIPPHWILQVAAYRPLADFPDLLDRDWPDAVEAVLTQQLRETMQEAALRQTIPRLAPVRDAVSLAVQAQYEEHPYPRWVSAGTAAPQELGAWLREKFSAARPVTGSDILVVGCGTGRHAVETSQRFAGGRTCAIDLSLASLAYAARKTKEYGLTIAYAQADLLAQDERRFDLIEAIGVLHHLADPFAGWRALLARLRTSGVMMVGLYSRMARKELAQARAHIESHRFGVDNIAAARQSLMAQPHFAALAERPDFFTTSNCRDLLMHVQEQQVTLAEISTFLEAQHLTLLGFALDDAILARYRREFPSDATATDLANWQAFESANPDTFSAMYQFWVQKA